MKIKHTFTTYFYPEKSMATTTLVKTATHIHTREVFTFIGHIFQRFLQVSFQ